MFIARTRTGETIRGNWGDVPDGLGSVVLVHDRLKLSVGLHEHDRYGFVVEGVVALQGSVNMPRVAEHLYGVKDGRCTHIRLDMSGKIEVEQLDEAPELAEHVWNDSPR